MIYKLFLLSIFYFFSSPLLAIDDLEIKNFDKEVKEIIDDFKKEISSLPKAISDEEESLDLAIEKFSEALEFTQNSIIEGEISSALNSIDFIANNISAAVKTIPSETMTSMEDVDFENLSDEEMNQMQEIMTDMNRKKMSDFKEMVTSMVVLEKQGFEAQNFMTDMEDLNMGLALLSDESVNIDFDLASLSDKGLEEVTKELDALEDSMKTIDVDKISDSVSSTMDNVSVESIADSDQISSVTEQVAESISSSSIADVTEEVSEVAEEVAEVAEEVAEVAEEVVEEVAESVEEVIAEVAESVEEIVEEVQEVVEEQEPFFTGWTFHSDGGLGCNMSDGSVRKYQYSYGNINPCNRQPYGSPNYH